MKKYLKTGALALALLGLTVAQPTTTTVQASDDIVSTQPGVLKVNYLANYSIAVWNTYGANRHTTGNYLKNRTDWKFFKVVKANGHNWYHLGGNQWVSDEYTTVLSGGQPDQTNHDNDEVTPLTNKQVKINYLPGYSVAEWDSYQAGRHTVAGAFIKHGAVVSVTGKVQSGDYTWYKLSDSNWVSSQYASIVDNSATKPETDSESVSGTVLIKYAGALKAAPSNAARTIRQLKPGESYKTFKRVVAEGYYWYNLGGNQWVNSTVALPTQLSTNDSVLLNVPYISQFAVGAYYGCEAASALQAMHYKGVETDMNLPQLLATMPIAADNDPHHGFAGSPYKNVNYVLQTIFPEAFTPWISHYIQDENVSGQGISGIKA